MVSWQSSARYCGDIQTSVTCKPEWPARIQYDVSLANSSQWDNGPQSFLSHKNTERYTTQWRHVKFATNMQFTFSSRQATISSSKQQITRAWQYRDNYIQWKISTKMELKNVIWDRVCKHAKYAFLELSENEQHTVWHIAQQKWIVLSSITASIMLRTYLGSGRGSGSFLPIPTGFNSFSSALTRLSSASTLPCSRTAVVHEGVRQ